MPNRPSIKGTHHCYGCGVCTITCPTKVIEIRQDRDGFYEPNIFDEDHCIHCGLCMDVCSYHHEGLASMPEEPKSYGAWSKDPVVRRKCSSGGIGFELGKFLIGQGFKVCGVRFNTETNQAEHYIATTVEELIPSIGSKYIQSYTVDGFKAINKKEKYLVTGTPCQIDSFRRFIKKFHCEDNFILMDFFCHGVPSKLIWDKYKGEAEKKVGELTYVSWRNKFNGWHDSWWMAMDGEKMGEPVDWHRSYNLLMREKKSFFNSKATANDSFYRLFFCNECLGEACYKCKFKYDHSSADIRIGDAWGSHYEKDENGVSCLIALTEKGKEVIARMDNIVLEPLDLDVACEGQMKAPPKFDRKYRRFLLNLLKLNALSTKQIGFVQRVITKLKRTL